MVGLFPIFRLICRLIVAFSENLVTPTCLCGELPSGQFSWYLYADIYCLDYDGNILDASLAALLAALRNGARCSITFLPRSSSLTAGQSVQLPKIIETADGQLSSTTEGSTQLELALLPIAVSFGLLDEHILVDPNAEEESLLTGTLSFILDGSGNLLNLLKSGGAGISEPHIEECLRLSQSRVEELLAVIDQAVTSQ